MAKLQSVGSVAGKETIYVDIDEEITGIIDKVSSAKGKVVALVLPKRATVLQSIVNMKLLKRSAENAGKNLVLVTSEAGLMPLAGTVGLHVASTPTSKPEIPPAPTAISDEPEDVDEPLDIVDGSSEPDNFDPKAAGATAVGALAIADANKADADSIDEAIDMADDAELAAGATAGAVATKAPTLKKDKKLKVPNFDSLRKRLVLGGLILVLLIGGLIYALTALPHAKITIRTNTSAVTSNVNVVLDANAKKLDVANSIVPATPQSQQKTSTQQVPATGQQNNGASASGTVTVTNCSGSNYSVQAGSSMSGSGHTFIVQSPVTVPDSNYTSPISGSKCKNDGKATVNVTALHSGAEYNIAPSAFTLSGSPSNVTGQGSQMNGGTDSIVKIVTQSDIDGATSKIKAEDNTALSSQLAAALQSKGLQPITATFVPGTPIVTSSAKAGDAADTVTVTAATTYTMLGVQKSDLRALVVDNVNKQIDKSKQVILDDGIANAKFTAPNPATATGASVAMEAKSVAGPQIDSKKLQTSLAGKKSGDIKTLLKQTPGVTDVKVQFGPFWVDSVPAKPDKVQVVVVKSNS